MTFAKYLLVIGTTILAIGTMAIFANIAESMQVPIQAKSGNTITGMVLWILGIYLLILAYFE